MIIDSNYITSAISTKSGPNPKCKIKLIKRFELPYSKIKQYIETVTLLYHIPVDIDRDDKIIEYLVEKIDFCDTDDTDGLYENYILNFNTTNDERVKALLKLYE